jgi:DivIVA domain-containing protein
MANGTDPVGQSTPRVVTPEEIQHQEFGVSRFGGYRMRDVDEFLDRLTASTQALVAENERLRGGDGPILGTPDLEEVNRQADEILQRARAEAAGIVAEASAVAAAGSTAPGDRTAVDAFLTQERDFLQNLATLVQAHAETVKAMAKRARQAPAETPAPPERQDAASVVDVTDGASEPSAPEDAMRSEIDAERDLASTPEPAASPEPRQTPARPEQGSEGDPSLRALFWGDD